MKVAYVSLAPFISGAERSLQAIVALAPRHGVEPVVWCPPTSPLLAWCVAANVPVTGVELARRDKWHPFRWIRSVRALRRLLREQQIDLVHCNHMWAFPAVGTAAGRLGVPRVCHMRDEISPAAARWCCGRGLEAVICISDHIRRQWLAAGLAHPSRDLVETLLNPVALVETAPATAIARDRSALVLGFAGQLAPVKGLRELLESLAGLPAGLDWRLLIAGQDFAPGHPYETACREIVERLALGERVSFLGFLENMTEFYQRIDVAVVPSFEEPLGRIPLEAAAHGKPAIASAVGGLTETIVSGRTGWLVPRGDRTALQDAITAAARDRALVGSMGARARERLVTAHDPDAYMEHLVAIYRAVERPPRSKF